MNDIKTPRCPHIRSKGEGGDFCELTERVSGRIGGKQ